MPLVGRWGRREDRGRNRQAVGLGSCEIQGRVVNPERAVAGAAIIIDRMGGGMIVIAIRRVVAESNAERGTSRPAHDRAGGEQADQDQRQTGPHRDGLVSAIWEEDQTMIF